MPNRPKGTLRKIQEGNPGKRPINWDEPIPETGIPPMPEWLKVFPVAVEEWDRESKILDDMGLITVADAALLANRSYIMSQIQEMAQDIQREGRVAYTQKMDSLGNEVMEAKSNPKTVQLAKLLTEHRQYGSLLGLDAPSRTKLVVNPNKAKKSKWANRIAA
jgi:P27 family predicted phage terminase small subunit